MEIDDVDVHPHMTGIALQHLFRRAEIHIPVAVRACVRAQECREVIAAHVALALGDTVDVAVVADDHLQVGGQAHVKLNLVRAQRNGGGKCG